MYRETLKALTSEKIRVSLLREQLNEIENQSELDILIDSHNFEKAKALLVDLGWVIYKNDGYSINRKYVAAKVVSRRCYLLDIHTSLIQNDLIYLDNEWFFCNCTQVGEYLYQPEPIAYLYHLALHVILGKGKLAEKYISRLQSLQLSPPEQEELFRVARRYGLKAMFKEILDNPISILNDRVQVKRLNKISRNALLPRDPGYLWRKARKQLYRFIGPLFGRSRGISIAFIGPDGAGKSTFINQLEQKLEEFGLSTRNAYMGPWFRNKFFTTLMLESIGANPADEIPGLDQVTSPFPRAYKKAKGLIRRYLYYFNLPLETYFRYFRYVYLQSLRGKVVLIDRYIHDLEVGYKNKQVKNNRGLRRLIVKITPTPDIKILLYNDPDTIWERKKQHEPEEIRRAMERYLDVAERYSFDLMKTDQECSALIDRFIDQHWAKLYEKKADHLVR